MFEFEFAGAGGDHAARHTDGEEWRTAGTQKAAQQNSGEPELLAKILELGAVYQENLKNIKHKASYIMGGKTLTAREAEIANFVVQGRTNAEIAAEMFIAEITVSHEDMETQFERRSV